MEVKKSKKADLEGKKAIFLEIGLIVALGIVIFAFSLNQKERVIQVMEVGGVIEEMELIDNTVEKQPEAPPVQQTVRVIADILNVVRNDTQIDTNFDFVEFGEDEMVIPTVAIQDEVIEEETILIIAEKMPTFQGGDLLKFRNWVSARLNYPELAREYGIQGTVTLTFVVEKDGRVSNIQALQSPDKMLSDEAIRVISQSPKWEPGRQRDQNVRIRYTFPLAFKLQN